MDESFSLLTLQMFDSIFKSMRLERLVSSFQSGIFLQQIEKLHSYGFNDEDMQLFATDVSNQLHALLMPDLFGYDLCAKRTNDCFKGILHKHQIKKLKGLIQKGVRLLQGVSFSSEFFSLEMQVQSLPDNIADIIAAYPLEELPDFLYTFNNLCEKCGLDVRYTLPTGYELKEESVESQKDKMGLIRERILLGVDGKTPKKTGREAATNRTPKKADAINFNCTKTEFALLFKLLENFGLINVSDKELAEHFTISGKPVTDSQLRTARGELSGSKPKRVMSKSTEILLEKVVRGVVDIIGTCNDKELKELLHTISDIRTVRRGRGNK